jgi:very-short-patch-repair endonuclease
MTEAEQKLWYLLRRKQIQGLQFYRQKPLLNYIVDFYCPKAKLVIELDGGQHFEEYALKQDQIRTEALSALGLTVIRFDNRQVLLETNAVLEQIVQTIQKEIPPSPPLIKGGSQSPEGAMTAHSLKLREQDNPPLEKGGQGGFATKENKND